MSLDKKFLISHIILPRRLWYNVIYKTILTVRRTIRGNSNFQTRQTLRYLCHNTCLQSPVTIQLHFYILPVQTLLPGFAPSTTGSSGENFILTLLTQCLSSVGLLYPSPLNTCPKWPPQFEHTISVLSIPNVLSVCLVTAPGILSKYAGHPHPDLNLWLALYRGASQPAQV